MDLRAEGWLAKDSRGRRDVNYYRRYVGDYLSKTARLSVLEHGAYNLLLDYYYAEEKPIPLDMMEVYTMVRAMTVADRKAVDRVLAKFFKPEADGFHNQRADHEIEVAQKARTNGERGGRPKTDSITGNGTDSITGSGTGNGAGGQTGDGGGSGHPPSTNHQPPSASPQPPTANHQPPISAAARRRDAAEERAARSRPARQAYSEAYERRWEVEPTWDKQANSMMAQFVGKVGVDDAPAIAAFYLSHNRQDYVRSKHDVSLLLRDARGLRTEWLSGRQVTDTQARQADRTGTTAALVNDLLAEAADGRPH